MTQAVVQSDFQYDATPEQLLDGSVAIAPNFADIDGLVWKLWIIAPDRTECRGIYPFQSEAQARAYLDSEIVAQIKRQYRNVEAKLFGIMEAACDYGASLIC